MVLSSPGVSVQIINESFYVGANVGTIPLVVLATTQDKIAPSGVGIASYTTKATAGKLFLATSQRELSQAYGSPIFYSNQGTPLHGYELNEYGLHAAYQYLGKYSRVYTLRADIDLNQLDSSATSPRGLPINGTYWLDLSSTVWGVFQSTGNSVPGLAWQNQEVKVVPHTSIVDVSGTSFPQTSFGGNGDFAIVPWSSDNQIFEKIADEWYRVGSSQWKAAHPTILSGTANPNAVIINNTLTINGTTVTLGGTTLSSVVTAINSANITNISATMPANTLTITNSIGGSITIANGTGTPLTVLGITPGVYKGVTTSYTNDALYPSGSISGDVWFKGSSSNRGSKWVVKQYNSSIGQWVTLSAPHFSYSSTLDDTDSAKDAAANASLGSVIIGTIYIGFDASTGSREIRRWTGTMWEGLVYEADDEAPSSDPEAGVLWYNTDFKVDIMYGTGTQWTGYGHHFPNTDPAGVIISGSRPLLQSDGTALVDNDIWLDSSDLENYPMLYRYNSTTLRWNIIDNTDATSPFGIVFADARQDSGPTFGGITNASSYVYNSTDEVDLRKSDFVDPDAPDPRLYPDGMLLFNTRVSTYNVKEWQPDYFEVGGFDPSTDFTHNTYTIGSNAYTFPALSSAARWVTVSGNKHDGSPWMGRKAQRSMIVRAMGAAIQTNDDLRSELVNFNLMASPGYPEMIDELISLNTDQKEVSFIIGDTPARLKPTGTDIQAWAANTSGSPTNGEDGLASSNDYVAVYYPWGLSTNVDGTEVMVPPSTMALQVYGYNDDVGYPWLAPAGYQRGTITNATSVGYLSREGEFKTVFLGNGQRDVLYTNKINPIAYIVGRGLSLFGQKTLAAVASKLDRVNVARLANYLNYELDNRTKTFLFQQNDQQTRDSARITIERFMNGLVGLAAIEDYAVLCDESNNWKERRDRNELYIDIAIKPYSAVEFIYIPVRVRATAGDVSL